jgi:amino acid permease
MDERLSNALEFSNYMVTLNNQKKALLEKFKTNIIFYKFGATFTLSKELITFVKTLIDYDIGTDTVLVDDNGFPVMIPNLQEFFDEIMNQYFSATNEYFAEYQKLKSKRTVESLFE